MRNVIGLASLIGSRETHVIDVFKWALTGSLASETRGLPDHGPFNCAARVMFEGHATRSFKSSRGFPNGEPCSLSEVVDIGCSIGVPNCYPPDGLVPSLDELSGRSIVSRGRPIEKQFLGIAKCGAGFAQVRHCNPPFGA